MDENPLQNIRNVLNSVEDAIDVEPNIYRRMKYPEKTVEIKQRSVS